MPQILKIFGPPGTGKTRSLIQIIQREIQAGVPPDKIAVLTFSRRATAEARRRGARVLGLDEEDMALWGTLHSTAAKELGIRSGGLMTADDWYKVASSVGVELDPPDEDGRPAISEPSDEGRTMVYTYSVGKARRLSAREAWETYGRGVSWKRYLFFSRTLDQYKSQNDLLDYPDLIEAAPGRIGARVVAIDEAQDLTPAQWDYARRIFRDADRVYVAGDDDQSIYSWAGADPEMFLQLEGRETVLSKSWRLPSAIWNAANVITSRIRRRRDKVWGPRPGEGLIETRMREELVPIDDRECSWLLLARTGWGANRWARLLRNEGIVFRQNNILSVRPAEARAIEAWENARRGHKIPAADARLIAALSPLKIDIEEGQDLVSVRLPSIPWNVALTGIPPGRRIYYEACMTRDPRSLFEEPKISVSTIHAAKGAEADHVAILTDTSPRIERSMARDPDAEHRVWYVAATRARERLFLVAPTTAFYYRMPGLSVARDRKKLVSGVYNKVS